MAGARRLAAIMLSVGFAFALWSAAAPAAAEGMTVTVCSSGCDFSSVNTAVNSGLTSGDVVDVFPGTYTEQVIFTQGGLTIQGDPGGAPPLVTWDDVVLDHEPDWRTGASGGTERTTLRHLDVRAPRGRAISSGAPIMASDLSVAAGGTCMDLRGGGTIGPGVTATTLGMGATCIQGGAGTLTIRGVTVNAPFGLGALLFSSQEGVSTITDSTLSGRGALELDGAVGRRLTLNGTDFGLATRSAASVLSDSVATATAPGGQAAVAFPPYPPGPYWTTLRNVTAVATGSGSVGIAARGFDPSAPRHTNPPWIDAKNVIARGEGTDVLAEPAPDGCFAPTACGPGLVTLSHSNFVTTSPDLVAVPDGRPEQLQGAVPPVVGAPPYAHNQSQDPLFVNGIVGPDQNFHLASAASPAILGGISDPANGATDRDGALHLDPPTLGAYEHSPPDTQAAASGPARPSQPAFPRVSRATITPSRFAAAPSGRSVVAAVRRSRGARVSFALNMAATVRFTVVQPRTGRRTRRGTCAKATNRTHRAHACTRLALLPGSFTVRAHAGDSSLRFTGRLGRHSLKPGRYQLAATPSAGGHSGRARHAAFSIIR